MRNANAFCHWGQIGDELEPASANELLSGGMSTVKVKLIGLDYGHMPHFTDTPD